MYPFDLARGETGLLYTGEVGKRKAGHQQSWMSLNHPTGGPYTIKPPLDLNGWSSSNIDIKPPGVREQMPDPSRPYLGPYRSNLFQRNDTSINNVPILNYDPDPPSIIANPWAQRYSSAMHDVLRETAVKEHWLFRDFGQFNVPYTGFTALKDLHLSSTRGCSL